LNTHRREHILEKISNHRKVTVADIASSLDVSDETVRRDLKDLEKEGLLRRIHGGAISVAAIRDEPISERVRKAAQEKGIIAQLASELISDGTSVFLNIGSTIEALARQLDRFDDLKVYTNSLNVAQISKEFKGVTVFVTPGQLRPVESDLVGYDTISYIKNYHFDTVFMSVAGIDVDRGFMDYEEDEVRVRQALIKSARNRVVMADSSKFGKTANMYTASFDGIERFVTDRRPTPEFIKCFKEAGMEVIHG
jgi:DeoR family glycerol-3-phosphate regulon repressor